MSSSPLSARQTGMETCRHLDGAWQREVEWLGLILPVPDGAGVGEHTEAQGAPMGSGDVQENLCGRHPMEPSALWVLRPGFEPPALGTIHMWTFSQPHSLLRPPPASQMSLSGISMAPAPTSPKAPTVTCTCDLLPCFGTLSARTPINLFSVRSSNTTASLQVNEWIFSLLLVEAVFLGKGMGDLPKCCLCL